MTAPLAELAGRIALITGGSNGSHAPGAATSNWSNSVMLFHA
jgi:hypothetical protein